MFQQDRQRSRIVGLPIGVRIDPCATTARACFKVAYIHAFVPYPTSRSANRVARRAASDAAQWASNAARISQSSISIFPRVTRRSHSPPCAQSNAPALDCCLCGQLKLQGAARSIEPQSRFLGSGGCHLMRNRFPRNCRIRLGSLENVVLLTGDRKFESIPLQRTVCLSSAAAFEGREPGFRGGFARMAWRPSRQRRRDVLISLRRAAMSLSGRIPVPR
jgi:hypothetical protein